MQKSEKELLRSVIGMLFHCFDGNGGSNDHDDSVKKIINILYQTCLITPGQSRPSHLLFVGHSDGSGTLDAW